MPQLDIYPYMNLILTLIVFVLILNYNIITVTLPRISYAISMRSSTQQQSIKDHKEIINTTLTKYLENNTKNNNEIKENA